METVHYILLIGGGIVGLFAGAALLNGEKHWKWTGVAIAMVLAAWVIFPVSDGGSCHIAWDGRGNPTECD